MRPFELAAVAPGEHAFLAHVARGSARRASAARALRSEARLRRIAGERAPCRHLARHGSGFDVIAEVKFSSPSEGRIASDAFLDGRRDADAALLRAAAYAGAGACAVSVLTEPSAFGGSLEHLRRVADEVAVPVLRKDFLVDPYQVWEARAQGADGVLLVARIVDDARLAELLDASEEAGLFALVEAFDAEDLERIRRAVEPRRGRPLLVGVNNRDLDTLAVDLARCAELAGALPEGFPGVAESGLTRAADAERVARCGYGLALVGSALMKSNDPAALLAAMLASGRQARRSAGGAP